MDDGATVLGRDTRPTGPGHVSDVAAEVGSSGALPRFSMVSGKLSARAAKPQNT